MKSLWQDTISLPQFQSLRENVKTDVLIIGGGITGILCAYCLKQAGINYILVEANRICHGITQNTTAKITCQHGLIYHNLVKRFGKEKAQMYLQANIVAFDGLQDMCQKTDCDYEIKDSLVYSLTDERRLEQELQALQMLGYPADYVCNIPLPTKTAGAIRFKNQAQFHPLKFINSIAKDLRIYENTKIIELDKNLARTNDSLISVKNIVMATHFPIINKHGGYFLKMYQSRSYVLALENAQDMNGMYVDASGNGLSFRNFQNLLLLGGGGHRTGKNGGSYKELYDFKNKYYSQAQIKYQWATQDCMTLDQVPYIGLYGKHTQNFFVATGFNKWGMTTSMVSATLIRDMILEKENPYASVFEPHRSSLRSQLFINIGEATKNLVTFSKKRCPHLGCALKWNAVEHTWDCPCHGSRFEKNGQLINNPATDDLEK